MKRYIETVYDNSGSMNDRVRNKTKYEIAHLIVTSNNNHFVS